MASARGFMAVLLLRLVPLFPSAPVDCAAGATGIRLVPYVTTTAIGIVPATVAYVGLGGTLDDPSSPGCGRELRGGEVEVGGTWGI
ncbi:VTT domain-containing protein [Streptomyces dysideae]|uniref:VTT domain-containing protein n=1 Tax=Streptomyces dysideae TaxID=909626 RepID=UPI0026CC4D69